MSKIYAGVSAFFANRAGNHNWLDNNARPFISLITTGADGNKSYTDLFLNKHEAIKVKATKTQVVLTFPADLNQPLFRVLSGNS